MLLPIALKYNEYGLLQFVRCLYFDVDTSICQEMYAACSRDNKNRDYFQNYVIKTARSLNKNIFSYDHNEPSYVFQTAPVVPDTHYDLALNLPLCAIDLSYARVLEIPAREYLTKYSHTLKTNNLTILDSDDNVINETSQVIAPKMTFYSIRRQNISGTPWLIRQYSCPILDDVCFQYKDYKLANAWDIELNVQRYAPIFSKYRKTYNRSVFVVDYKGNIFKMLIEKALELDTELGNLDEQVSLPDYLYIDCGLYEIKPFDIRYSKFNKTAELEIQGTLQGVSDIQNHYEDLLSPQVQNIFVPSVENLILHIPETYAARNIRFADVFGTLRFVSKAPLDALILPRYAKECNFHVKSVNQIKLPEYCSQALSGYFANYNSNKFELDIRNGVTMVLRNATNLEYVGVNITNNFSIIGDVAPEEPPRVTITDARNLKQVRVLQSDLSKQYIQKLMLIIQHTNGYTLDLNCNIEYAYLQTNHGGQDIVINIGQSVSELEISTEQDLDNKYFINIAKSSRLNIIQVTTHHGRVLYKAHRDKNKWTVDILSEYAPEMYIDNLVIETE